MKIHIKNLGPLTDTKLKLGDITVLLGPPNVGKSYTLRALYGKLAMLDPVILSHALEEVVSSLLSDFIEDYSRKFQEMLIAFANLYYEIEGKEDIEKLLKEKMKKKINVNVEFDKKNLIISLNSEKTVKINDVIEALNHKLETILRDLLPIKDDTDIQFPDFPTPDISLLLIEVFKKPLKYKTKKEYPKLSREFSDISEFEISLELEKNNIKISINAKILATSSILEYIQKRRELAVHKIYRMDMYRLRVFYEGVFSQMIISRVETLITSTLGIPTLQSIIFIPFGRSPLVCLADTETEIDPSLFLPKENPIYISYLEHIEKGRSKFSKGKFEKDIVDIFSPVFQGELVYDQSTHKLRYHRWGAPDVPIPLSSALASEITGIFLSILNVPPNSCIIIEEPEAQLHYSAQILMALVLVALSKKFGHKIVFSTHSDIFAIILAYLKELHYDEKNIIELISNLLKMQGVKIEKENLKPIAQIISSKEDFSVKFYYYKPTKDHIKVIPKSPKKIMEDVPGITKVLEILVSWAAKLG